MPTPDAIKDWKSHDARLDPPDYHDRSRFSPPYYHIDQAIIDDYQAFEHKVLSKLPGFSLSDVYFYEDGTGKHAVRIELESANEEHIDYYLIYDANNVRIKVIKGKTWYHFHM